jgi:hypothetical protein
VENLWKNRAKPKETPRKDGARRGQKGEEESKTLSALLAASMRQVFDNKQFI